MNIEKKEKVQDATQRFSRSLRIVVGIIVSILLAELAGIQFAPSTGVVALLGIQNTKKESLQTLFRRIVSFAYTMAIAVVVHEYIGGQTEDFILLVFFMVVITMLLNWENTLSINLVIAVHLFLQTESFTTALLLNETKRIIIGMTVAVLVNWKHSNKEKVYEKLIIEIESNLRRILVSFCAFLNGQKSLEGIESQLQEYSVLIKNGLKNAYIYSNNNLLPHANYYVNYMKMRENELVVLDNIYELFKQLHDMPQEACILAERMIEMSEDVPVLKPMDKWLVSFKEMENEMQKKRLSDDPFSFEDAAVMLFVVRELQHMIHIKQTFISSLTPAQLKKYHHETKESSNNVS